ncbi:MAG: mechanosensitive ion channel family protein [Chitinophagales bacterium]
MDFSQINIADLQAQGVLYGTRFIGGILVLVIGWWIISFINSTIRKIVTKNNIDPTLKPVITSTVSILLKVMLLLAFVSTLGVETTSFVAVLGAFGLAAGLAMQGSLGNLAGGFLILFFRPFNVGDYIKAQGYEGFVKEIQLFTTILETHDKQTIYLPNGTVSGGSIVNVSQIGIVRLHLAIGIGYGENIGKAKDAILKVMQKNPLVLNEPAPSVAVVNLGDSSVDLDMRPWCKPGNAPAVTVQILEAAKIALDNAGIEIPFPQQVVHHINAQG